MFLNTYYYKNPYDMFANTREMIKKFMICLRKHKNGLFIHSVDSRHVEALTLLVRDSHSELK